MKKGEDKLKKKKHESEKEKGDIICKFIGLDILTKNKNNEVRQEWVNYMTNNKEENEERRKEEDIRRKISKEKKEGKPRKKMRI